MSKKYSNAEQKERIRQRVRVQIDEENYQFFPERKDPDYYDNDVNQRVGVYVRVSTDDPRQTTSYELQKSIMRTSSFVTPNGRWLTSMRMKASAARPQSTVTNSTA